MRQPAILVVRPDGRFSEVLRKDGCEVINLELIKTETVSDQDELVNTIQRIDEYDGVFLTSPVAAEIALRLLTSEARKFSGKVYVLGERAKSVMDSSGLQVISSAAANTAQDLIESFEQSEFAGRSLLFIRGDRSVRTIPEMLAGIARVDELVVYKTVEVLRNDTVIEDVRDRLKRNDVGWTCLFSPSGVDSFISNFGSDDLARVRAAAIGETTARRATEAGLNVGFISERSNAEDFAVGFAAYIKNIE